MVKKPHDGAQHQHYVPKFILRNFLSLAPRERDREQVRVFDKVRRAPISNPVSIDNIMGERRFHDFQVDDAWVSAEEAIGDIEHGVLPAYRSLVDERRFSNSIEERAAVSMLLALQFLRTREMRDRFQDLDDKLEAHIRRLGGTMDMLEGWEPQDENARKIRHVDFLARTIREFATIISKKHFLLFEPPPGRSFYTQ